MTATSHERLKRLHRLLEMVAPAELRQVLAAQAEKMAAIYRAGAD